MAGPPDRGRLTAVAQPDAQAHLFTGSGGFATNGWPGKLLVRPTTALCHTNCSNHAPGTARDGPVNAPLHRTSRITPAQRPQPSSHSPVPPSRAGQHGTGRRDRRPLTSAPIGRDELHRRADVGGEVAPHPTRAVPLRHVLPQRPAPQLGHPARERHRFHAHRLDQLGGGHELPLVQLLTEVVHDGGQRLRQLHPTVRQSARDRLDHRHRVDLTPCVVTDRVADQRARRSPQRPPAVADRPPLGVGQVVLRNATLAG